MDWSVKGIQTTASVDQKQNRERQTVLTKVRDLLLSSIFAQHEIFFLQSAHHPGGVLLQHQRIDSDKIDVNLDDIVRLVAREHTRRGRVVRILCGRRIVAPAYPSLSVLTPDSKRQKEEF